MQKRTQKDQDKIKLVLTQTVILSVNLLKFKELDRELVEFVLTGSVDNIFSTTNLL